MTVSATSLTPVVKGTSARPWVMRVRTAPGRTSCRLTPVPMSESARP